MSTQTGSVGLFQYLPLVSPVNKEDRILRTLRHRRTRSQLHLLCFNHSAEKNIHEAASERLAVRRRQSVSDTNNKPQLRGILKRPLHL